MVSQQSPDRKGRKSGRDNEVVAGFDHYHRVACKLARKQYLAWFPTRDDLVQAAALAAVEAIAELGEQTTLKALCLLVDRILYQQATAYGLRSLTDRKAKTRQNIRREVCLCEILVEDESTAYLEFHRGAIGVGQFTIASSRHLHRLVNLPDPADTTNHHKDQLRAQMYQVLDSDPELSALRDWYLARNGYFGYDAMQQEGLCGRNKGHRLIVKARRLAGVECSQHELEMAQLVATAYQSAADKRTRQLGEQLGLSKSSVVKWLNLARWKGLLPPEKSIKQQVIEAHQEQPQASSREIGVRLGLSKTTVLRWRTIAKAEQLIA